jgi:hypothetical protein
LACLRRRRAALLFCELSTRFEGRKRGDADVSVVGVKLETPFAFTSKAGEKLEPL